MRRIDAHQHFWKYNPGIHTWIDDTMAVLKQDFMPEHLQPLLRQHDIDGCIVIQVEENEADNIFMLSLAQRNPCIKGIIAWIDLMEERTLLSDKLAYYASLPHIKGFRYMLQGKDDRRMMLSDLFQKNLSQLQAHGFIYELLIKPDQLVYAIELVGHHPLQKFVIDHIAKPNIRDRSRIDEWQKNIREIAQFENVYCKLSGVVTEADWHTWTSEDVRPYIHLVIDAFGIDRVMYGSDWPVCLVAAQYGRTVELIDASLSAFSISEQEKIWSHNAIQLYSIQ